MKKSFYLFSILLLTIFITNCSSFNEKSLTGENQDSKPNCEETIIIGDNIIYGESFSFQDIAFQQNRNAENQNEELIDMVYFSIQPSNYEGLCTINELYGYLNPYELNKEIIETCDPDNLIFDSEKNISNEINPVEIINFDTKYYYVDTLEHFESNIKSLEGIEIIENFSICPFNEDLTEDDEQELDETSEKFDENSSRSIFSKTKINGTLCYSEVGYDYPVNGIRIRREGINGSSSCKIVNGDFDLGKVRNLWTQWLWLDFKNDACLLTNMAGLTASVLVKTGQPNKLHNMLYFIKSKPLTGKIAICNEILSRYNWEKNNRKNCYLPKALVWVTSLGSGISSAPCLHYLNETQKTDLLFTDYENIDYARVFLINHEYTHFLHCVYTNNKDSFWGNIFFSEIYSSLNQNIDGLYDFTNKYVCFAENLAEWYSYVGFKRGVCGKKKNTSDKRDRETFKNVELFSQLCDNELLINANEKYIKDKSNVCEERIIDLVKKYRITTFQEFYNAMIKEYPNNKVSIKEKFMELYVSYGNNILY